MIFRTTILRSNPQIIRVFEIDAESSLEDLLSVVACVHGWTTHPALHIYRNGKERDKTELIQNHFLGNMDGKEWMILTLMGPGQIIDYNNPYERVWRIRLEVLSSQEEEKSENLPRLIRYHGFQPVRTPGSIENWNHMAVEMDRTGHFYEYSRGWIDADEFLVNLKEINRKLIRNKTAKGWDLQIIWDRSRPVGDLISNMTVDELKDVIRMHGMPIKTNIRKALLIENLKKYLETDRYWKKVLEDISLEEYEDFMHYVTEKHYTLKTTLFTLRKYAAAYPNNNRSIVITREFLETYENMMMTEGDESLIKEKMIEEVYRCAENLYGFFTQTLLLGLAKVMYPKDITEDEVLGRWRNGNGRTLLKSELYNRRMHDRTEEVDEDVMYGRRDFDVKDVLYFRKIMKKIKIDHYVPDRESALVIARNPYGTYTENDEKLMKKLQSLTRGYYYYSVQRIRMDIYEMCHLSFNTREIVQRIKSHYMMLSTKKDETILREAILEYKKNIRQVLLMGYTAIEAKKLWNLELEDK